MVATGIKKIELHHVAAGLAFASQFIHLWSIPGQFVAASVPAGFFFLVAIGQGLLGGSLLFGARRLAIWLGILSNVWIVFVWCVTSFIPIPTLLEPMRLPFDGIGAIATVVEVALVVVLLRLRKYVLPKKRRV